jgi:two-component system chemotaxis response regulator CheB
MGRDGLEGMRAIKTAGGHTLVQDEASSVVYGMARVVDEAGLADRTGNLDHIIHALIAAGGRHE